MSSNKANPISLSYKNQVHEGTDETEGATTRSNPDAGISSPPIVTAQAVVDSTEDLTSATGQTTAPGRKRLVWASGCVLLTVVVVVAAILGTLLTRSEPVEDPLPPEEADMRALFLMERCPGILDLASGACCPRACGQCGGRGCAVADGGAERCCTVDILESSSFCEAGGEAPCIVNVEDPDPSCELGLLDLFDGIGCCPSQCLLCGGSGCSGMPGGWANCCIGGINSLQTTCDITGAPCVVQESFRRRNLAYQKNATQSSQLNIDFPPGNAVDGNVESISHTAENDPNPWWEVDLGEEFFVREVRLFNRRDCCSHRLSNATVQLLDSSGGVLTPLYNFTMFRSDGVSLIVNTIGNTADVTDILWPFAEDFATDPPARRLRVSLPSRVAPDPDHFLSLAHVVVYGIPT